MSSSLASVGQRVEAAHELRVEIAVKRPGTGIDPMRWNEIIGKRAIRDFQLDELIEQ